MESAALLPKAFVEQLQALRQRQADLAEGQVTQQLCERGRDDDGPKHPRVSAEISARRWLCPTAEFSGGNCLIHGFPIW